MCALMLSGLAVVLPSAAHASGPSGTYIWGTPIATPVTNLNPLTATNLESEVTGVMYSTSMMLELSNGTILPWLASNYTMSNGGKTLTFNLVHNGASDIRLDCCIINDTAGSGGSRFSGHLLSHTIQHMGRRDVPAECFQGIECHELLRLRSIVP